MSIFRALIALFALTIMSAHPARAEEQDIAATVRGVVRVVIFAVRGDEAYYVQHGTGFAVTPDLVLTNAHVVELVRREPDLRIAIVPSQGKERHGGKLVAMSPRADLALISMSEGQLPVSTFYGGAVTDLQQVVALGYPGRVDDAEERSLSEIINPLSPVKSLGTVSAGRSANGVDTVLHTATIEQGSSGGPLVDTCGRVVGINSFGPRPDGGSGGDFGFAVSNREIAAFLRQAKVDFQQTLAPCRTLDDIAKDEDKRKQDEKIVQISAENEAQARTAEARDTVLRDIITERENAMAVAALLLGAAVLFLGWAGAGAGPGGHRRRAMWLGGGALLLLSAAAIYLTRTSFTELEDRLAARSAAPAPGDIPPVATYDPVGDNICRFDDTRSAVKVSDTSDLPVRWSANGCVNDKTQYGRDGAEWSRIFVPENDPQIRVNSFDPATGTYRIDRYLADADTLDKARTLRARFAFEGCGGDAATLEKLQRMQAEIRAVLPPKPNERIVYRCTKRVDTGA